MVISSRIFAGAVLALTVIDLAHTQETRTDYQLQNGAFRSRKRDDYYEVQARGGFRFIVNSLNLTVRGENLLLLHDLESVQDTIERDQQKGLPTRSVPAPSARRRLSAAAIRERLQHTLEDIGQAEIFVI